MRIAALIAAYHYPEALERLLDRLNTPLWKPFVHIDAKSNFLHFAHLQNKAEFSEMRFPVYWGGFGLVRTTLHLLKMALQDPAATHFYLMSGQCFPIKDDNYISYILSESEGNFMTYARMPIWHKPIERIAEWHYFDTKSAVLQTLLGKLFRTFPRRDVAKLLRGMRPFGGSGWWILNRSTVEKVFTFLRENAWYIKAFRFSEISDELFFHTLVLHLGVLPDRPSPTAVKWVPGAAHPETITRTILDEMKKDWHFMARKFPNSMENL
jgi:hypothetical protein